MWQNPRKVWVGFSKFKLWPVETSIILVFLNTATITLETQEIKQSFKDKNWNSFSKHKQNSLSQSADFINTICRIKKK